MMPAVNTRYFTAAHRRTLAQVNENLPYGLRTLVFRANEDGERFDVGHFLDRNGEAVYTFSRLDAAFEVEGVAVPSMEAVVSTVLAWEKARLSKPLPTAPKNAAELEAIERAVLGDALYERLPRLQWPGVSTGLRARL